MGEIQVVSGKICYMKKKCDMENLRWYMGKQGSQMENTCVISDNIRVIWENEHVIWENDGVMWGNKGVIWDNEGCYMGEGKYLGK